MFLWLFLRCFVCCGEFIYTCASMVLIFGLFDVVNEYGLISAAFCFEPSCFASKDYFANHQTHHDLPFPPNATLTKRNTPKQTIATTKKIMLCTCSNASCSLLLCPCSLRNLPSQPSPALILTHQHPFSHHELSFTIPHALQLHHLCSI